jgi:hypothetical protein
MSDIMDAAENGEKRAQSLHAKHLNGGTGSRHGDNVESRRRVPWRTWTGYVVNRPKGLGGSIARISYEEPASICSPVIVGIDQFVWLGRS